VLHGTTSQTVSTTLDVGTLDDQSSHSSSPDSTACRAVCPNVPSRPSMYDFQRSRQMTGKSCMGRG
jgi:hypothetical protein